MNLFFTLFVVLNLTLYAATPELFRPIGDPIYNEIPSVEKMTKMDYFAAQNQTLKDFIHEARYYKDLGFAYDKKHADKTLNKREQKIYIDALRDLDGQLKKIEFILKTALEEMIKKEKIKPFYELKNTGMSILRSDKSNARNIILYEKRLIEIKRSQEQKKIAETENSALTEYRALRSFQNLDGNWKDESNKEETVVANFDKKKLTLTYTKDKESHVLRGTYTIAKTLDFHIDKREQIKENVSHVRKLKLKRIFEIKMLTRKEILLQHKDETLRLKRF